MRDRTAALGLCLVALLAWALPPALRRLSETLAPASPVVYADPDASGFLWSPSGTARASAALPGGWQGLLLGAPLDLNEAGPEDLEALPGVGPKTAAAILEARKAAGGFREVEDLLRVPGIGAKRFEALRPLVRVAGGKER